MRPMMRIIFPLLVAFLAFRVPEAPRGQFEMKDVLGEVTYATEQLDSDMQAVSAASAEVSSTLPLASTVLTSSYPSPRTVSARSAIFTVTPPTFTPRSSTAWFSILADEWPAAGARIAAWLEDTNFGPDGVAKRRLGA